MKKIKSYTIILVLLSISQFSLAQSKKAIELSAEYLNVGHQKINNSTLVLRKWENIDTIKYIVIGEFQYMSTKSWIKFTEELELITGIKFIETADSSNAQITIFFGELLDYFKITKTTLPEKLTSTLAYWHNGELNKQGQLSAAGFCIVPSKIKLDYHGTYYLKNLFLKSLGLMGESSNESSLFFKYPNLKNTDFYRPDKRIIKIHYNQNIKSGMSYSQTKQVLKDSIDLDALFKEKL